MTSPQLPDGFWTITDALDYFGQLQHEVWTGEEYLARDLPSPEEAKAAAAEKASRDAPDPQLTEDRQAARDYVRAQSDDPDHTSG